jgi:hypothetical protein
MLPCRLPTLSLFQQTLANVGAEPCDDAGRNGGLALNDLLRVVLQHLVNLVATRLHQLTPPAGEDMFPQESLARFAHRFMGQLRGLDVVDVLGHAIAP